MSAPAPGSRVGGRYTLVRRLGAGGFGTVWVASDAESKSFDRPVAIKLLHPELHARRGRDFARFQREAQILGQLDHPSIARAISYDFDGEHAYIVMEYVDGLPLDKVLVTASRQAGAMDPRDAARIFDELCAAVAYAHDQGIVHRDLKPKNVMIVRRADQVFVKVLDFGIARVAGEAGDGATTVGRVIGSYFYMAPEQVRGERPDARADVFALGSMLYELITGHRAWARRPDGGPLPAHEPPSKTPPNTLTDISSRILTGPRPVPSDVAEGLPLGLDPVVAKALAVELEDRFASVKALSDAARPLLLERKGSAGMTIVQLEPLVRTSMVAAKVEEPDERVEAVEPVEPVELRSSAVMAVADATPVAWVSGSLGGSPPPATPRAGTRRGSRGLLVAVGLLALASAGVVFAWATLGREPTPLRAEAVGPGSEGADAPALRPRAIPGAVVSATAGASAGAASGGAAPREAVVATERTADGVAAAPAPTPGNTPRPDAAPRSPPAPPAGGPRASAPGSSSPATPAPEASRAPETSRARLERLLASARADAADLRAVTALGDAIRAEATRLPPSATRTRVLREVDSSLAYGDVDGLAAALRLLEAETAR